jgi:hypothetical protein
VGPREKRFVSQPVRLSFQQPFGGESPASDVTPTCSASGSFSAMSFIAASLASLTAAASSSCTATRAHTNIRLAPHHQDELVLSR